MFNGRLDDLALFGRALSASEVAALATRTVAHFGGLTSSNAVTVRVLAPESTPRLSGPSVSDSGWSMAVSGPSGADYTIFASTNLTSWMPLETRASPAIPFQWSDPDADLFPKRFYRVQVGP